MKSEDVTCPERHMSGMYCDLPAAGHASKHRGRRGYIVRIWGASSAPDPEPYPKPPQCGGCDARLEEDGSCLECCK
jgi:hypothetical protein